MPFKKVNIHKEIEQLKKDNPEFKEAYELLQKEKLLLKKAERYRRRIDTTRPESQG